MKLTGPALLLLACGIAIGCTRLPYAFIHRPAGC